MSVAAPVTKEPLTPEEESLLTEQVMPILRTRLPEPFIPRAMAAIKEAAEQSKKKHGLAFGGMLPNAGQVGVAPISPRDFNIATSSTTGPWTWRKHNAATGWRTGANALVNAQTMSKYTHVVMLAYENLDPVPKTVATKETIGGVEHPIIDLSELKTTNKQLQAIEPYIIGPISVCTIEHFVDAIGYDELQPWGFVIAPYAYLISKVFIA